MNRQLFVALAALAIATPAYAQPNNALGLWQTTDPDGRVRVSVCGQSVCGAIEPGAPAPGRPTTDVKNPDRALRSRSLAGLVIMDGFVRGARGWMNGRIYDPNTGNTYRSELMPQADGTLRVKGCFGPICRSETWRRIS